MVNVTLVIEYRQRKSKYIGFQNAEKIKIFPLKILTKSSQDSESK